MSIKLVSSGGGSVTIADPASTANNYTLNPPLANGNLVSTGDTGTVTPTMLSAGRPNWDSSGNFQLNSGYGSNATAYGCRAWVNFNGTGTVAIRASGNVTSITDNGVGDYTVNFTNAMTDANYAVSGIVQGLNSPTNAAIVGLNDVTVSITSSGFRIITEATNNGVAQDYPQVHLSIFR